MTIVRSPNSSVNRRPRSHNNNSNNSRDNKIKTITAAMVDTQHAHSHLRITYALFVISSASSRVPSSHTSTLPSSYSLLSTVFLLSYSCCVCFHQVADFTRVARPLVSMRRQVTSTHSVCRLFVLSVLFDLILISLRLSVLLFMCVGGQSSMASILGGGDQQQQAPVNYGRGRRDPNASSFTPAPAASSSQQHTSVKMHQQPGGRSSGNIISWQ
jgi:hypothetical protein